MFFLIVCTVLFGTSSAQKNRREFLLSSESIGIPSFLNFFDDSKPIKEFPPKRFPYVIKAATFPHQQEKHFPYNVKIPQRKPYTILSQKPYLLEHPKHMSYQIKVPGKPLALEKPVTTFTVSKPIFLQKPLPIQVPVERPIQVHFPYIEKPIIGKDQLFVYKGKDLVRIQQKPSLIENIPSYQFVNEADLLSQNSQQHFYKKSNSNLKFASSPHDPFASDIKQNNSPKVLSFLPSEVSQVSKLKPSSTFIKSHQIPVPEQTENWFSGNSSDWIPSTKSFTYYEADSVGSQSANRDVHHSPPAPFEQQPILKQPFSLNTNLNKKNNQNGTKFSTNFGKKEAEKNELVNFQYYNVYPTQPPKTENIETSQSNNNKVHTLGAFRTAEVNNLEGNSYDQHHSTMQHNVPESQSNTIEQQHIQPNQDQYSPSIYGSFIDQIQLTHEENNFNEEPYQFQAEMQPNQNEHFAHFEPTNVPPQLPYDINEPGPFNYQGPLSNDYLNRQQHQQGNHETSDWLKYSGSEVADASEIHEKVIKFNEPYKFTQTNPLQNKRILDKRQNSSFQKKKKESNGKWSPNYQAEALKEEEINRGQEMLEEMDESASTESSEITERTTTRRSRRRSHRRRTTTVAPE